MLVRESQQEGPSDDNGHPHLHASSPSLPSTFSVPVVGPFCLLVALRLPLPHLLLGRLGSVVLSAHGVSTREPDIMFTPMGKYPGEVGEGGMMSAV